MNKVRRCFWRDTLELESITGHMRVRMIVAALCCAHTLTLIGCRPQAMTDDEASGPATVTVRQPAQRDVTEYGYFIGRTEAVNSVEIKARVTAYLEHGNRTSKRAGQAQSWCLTCRS